MGHELGNGGEPRQDFLARVARFYYIDHLSQQEIAHQLGTSRSNVSRLLKLARESNIVEIRIHDSSSSMSTVLQQELVELFGLARAVVVSGTTAGEHAKMQAGRAAARLLAELLGDGMTVGIAWGSSLYYMVEDFATTRPRDATVVQLIGGSGARNLSTDGLELARKLSAKLNSTCHVLQAPLVVQSEYLKELLIQEPDIRSVLQKGEKVDIAIVGIGTIRQGESALVRAGYIDEAAALELQSQGVVGDIFGYQIDRDGAIAQVEINRRLIGMDPHKLKAVPTVIGVAAGVSKAEAICAALRSHYLSILVTDEAAALRIVSLQRERLAENRRSQPEEQPPSDPRLRA